jgi:hypothetical protein
VDKYKELQKDVVDELRKLGVYFQYDDRLALFWLRHNIGKLYGGDHTRLIDTIDSLVDLRAEGLEPKHEGGKYI